MLRLASDADVHGELVRGLRRREPELDLIRVQDALPLGTPDPVVLAWVSDEGRVLITNDRNTMVSAGYERLNAGLSMPGLVVASHDQSIGAAINDILLIASCMTAEEVQNQIVVFLPLR